MGPDTVATLLEAWRVAARHTGEDALRRIIGERLGPRVDDAEAVSVFAAIAGSGAGGLGACLASLAAMAADAAGTAAVVAAVAGSPTVGVLSHGPLTTSVVDGLLLADDPPRFLTDRPSVGRALEGIGAVVVPGEPARADRLLVPAVAVHVHRVWSSAPILAAAARATKADPTSVVVHARPLAHLTDAARARYRPPPWVTDASDERWSVVVADGGWSAPE